MAGGEGLTARLKALALACARVARPPGRAAHRARRAKRGSVRTPRFSSANSAIHIKKPAQGGSFNMAGGEGLTARLKALALACARVARPPGRAAHRARRAKRGSVRTPGFSSANSAIHIKKPAQGGSFNMAGGEGFEPPLTESESVVLPLDDPPGDRFLFDPAASAYRTSQASSIQRAYCRRWVHPGFGWFHA